ncbi:response regulator [Eubacteriaceae bacterium ES3]|nr:response regulator [Eubacteriaceae bacterium ES3]
MANILIVDDSTMSRNKLKKILISGDHLVVGEAADGIEAIEKFKELRPDIVTLDITMPNMNGIECLKEILALDEDANVVMISALGKGDTILEALNAGALNYISKPFEASAVLDIFKEAMDE